jgi:hypothetical protein
VKIGADEMFANLHANVNCAVLSGGACSLMYY